MGKINNDPFNNTVWLVIQDMDDRFNLQRFIEAQASVYTSVIKELEQGKKSSHWMWFIFPQFIGLGHSAMANRFAIRSAEEARAYLDHPLLGERLMSCAGLVNKVTGRTAMQIFGDPDVRKFRSSMTLFNQIDRNNPVFEQVLLKYYKGEPDPLTLSLLGRKHSKKTQWTNKYNLSDDFSGR
jgi:uncharacterized protein (DUF1810 family)